VNELATQMGGGQQEHIFVWGGRDNKMKQLVNRNEKLNKYGVK